MMPFRVALSVQNGAIDLDIELEGTGSPIALIGPNGAGKTTLLRWIAGRGVPGARGEIHIGASLVLSTAQRIELSPEARRIGYVPQGFGLFPHLSVIDNITFGLPKLDRITRHRVAARLLEEVGCEHLLNKRTRTLSGGEQQKIALVRALAVQPQLLLLDEPMAALDPASRRFTRQFLRHQLALRSAILTTHDARDVHALAGYVFVIENGRIVQSGTPSELAAEPATEFVAEFFETGACDWLDESQRVAESGAYERKATYRG